MISQLFRSKAKTLAPRKPTVPPGTVVWAIGDIHGRLDLLVPLLDAITSEFDESRAERKMVIVLGDYIDRGPDSRGVVQLLASLPKSAGIEWRFLMGNHEKAMLDFLDDATLGARWCEYGGDRALQSYGVRAPELAHRPEAWSRAAADLRHKLSSDETTFLSTLELSVTVGDYFFSHAGARPGVPLNRQSNKDLMWIRQLFLESETEFECVVVHGHTPTAKVHIDHRRIGVDTKAYDSGVLSAVRLEADTRTVVQAIGPTRGRDTSHLLESSLPTAGAVSVVRCDITA